MKNRIIILALLVTSLSVNAQIKKYNTAKTSKIVTPNSAQKLPLLKVARANNYTKISPEVLKSRSSSNESVITEFPRAYSNLTAALNETLTVKKLETAKAHLYFQGEYKRKNDIELRPNFRDDYLIINFKSGSEKTHRIRLYFNTLTTFNNGFCKNPKLQVVNGDTSLVMRIKGGQNVLDFLVKAGPSGWVYLVAFSNKSLTCDGELFNRAKHGRNYIFQFNKVEIKELVN